jgi:dinuclear metal center YbgI/SA1388 family protein
MLMRDFLTTYLNDFLGCDNYTDYAPNGLQVEGRADIQRICTAVTASYDVIMKANALNADALLVHHGYFWRGEEPVMTGMKRRRIGALMTHDINLYAYHLPLDTHPTLGNNIGLGRLLEMTNIQSHAVGKTSNLLWSGTLSKPMTLTELSTYVHHQLNRKPLCIQASKKHIQHVAWCTGGAQDNIIDAHRLGVDAYLSGEVSERTYYEAIELDLHYLACGHHATERYGIKALGEHLAEKFSIEHSFIDSENPI